MKATIGKEQLLQYGSLAERIAGRNQTFPILAGLRIEADANRISFRSTNLELGIEVTLPGKVAEAGVVVVSASPFFQILRSAGKGDMVSLEQKGGTLVVTLGASEAKLKTFGADDFPTIPMLPETNSFTLKKEELLRGIRSVWYAASTSLIKPELASVYLYEEKGNVVCVATDSFRLAEKIVPFKTNAPIGSFLLPSKNIPEVIRILEEAPDEITVRFTEHQMAFLFEYVYVTSRLVQGTFPDYRQIIPKTNATEMILLREDLQNALKKVSIFSDKFNQLRFTIQPKKKKAALFAKNEEIGEVTEPLEASLAGEDLEISFNMRYLSDALQSINSDSIALSFSGFGKPLVIRGVGDASFLYLVMPMNR
jgi:DNA polymerase-3 subunit beta